MSMIINIIIIIIYNYVILFILSFNISCNSNKLLIKSFGKKMFIINFPTFNF